MSSSGLSNSPAGTTSSAGSYDMAHADDTDGGAINHHSLTTPVALLHFYD